jgi:transposase
VSRLSCRKGKQERFETTLLIVRRTLREQFCILHRRLLTIVRDDGVCRRLVTTPGVGPVVSLTYRATVDVPARFRKSKFVGGCLS